MAVPYRIHTVLTDNGVQFVQHDRGIEGASIAHVFGRVCAEKGVEHRLTKPYHPWTNGQAERMVRTIKDATIRAFHYASINDLRRHVRDWLLAYNYAKQLRALQFKTPFEALKAISTEKPDLFYRHPSHHTMGLNTYSGRLGAAP
jgi:transposase InsO family protein